MRVPRPALRDFRGACIFAGSLFFLVRAPAADESPPPAPVTFVAWNLRNYLHTVAPPATATPRDTKPKPLEEVAAVTRILTSLRPDILGVCEIGGRQDLSALQRRLMDAGLELPHSELVQAADPGRHLGLLSRYPIIARQSQSALHYLLDETKLPVQRGFLDVTVQVTASWQLRCVGAHLKSRRDVPEAGEALMRRNEAHLLRQYADALLTADPDTNLLVYGDFNDTRDEPAVRAITGTRGSDNYLTAITPADAAGQRWTYYYPESDTYSRIDFLLASKGLNPEIDEEKSTIYSGSDWFSASDHRAITVVMHPKGRAKKSRRAVPAKDPNGQ